MTAAGDAGDPRFAWLTDAELRASLEGFVRRRCSPSEAADIVQTAIADALAAPTVPADRDGFRRLLFVVARRRLVDHLRRHRREVPSSLELEPAAPGVEPLASSELLQWVERELPQSEDHRTLEWMLREAEGDKLEHIAAEVSLPAPRVRQRVSRLRRRLKERWLSQLVAASVLGVVFSPHRLP